MLTPAKEVWSVNIAVYEYECLDCGATILSHDDSLTEHRDCEKKQSSRSKYSILLSSRGEK